MVSYGSSSFSFLRNFHTAFHNDYTNFTFPPAVDEGSYFTVSLPTFVVVVVVAYEDSHCNWGEMKS
jgi:hypothetical protein